MTVAADPVIMLLNGSGRDAWAETTTLLLLPPAQLAREMVGVVAMSLVAARLISYSRFARVAKLSLVAL